MLTINAVAELYFYLAHYADIREDEKKGEKRVKGTAAGDCRLFRNYHSEILL